MGKYHVALWAMLAVTAATAPAFAQEAPVAAAKEQAKPKAETLTGRPGAASSSYARCAPGTPIGGIVVKGGVNPTKRSAEPEGACTSEEAATPAMPSRLSMTPTTTKAVAPAATQLLKRSISEKGVK
ncbi:hypothetical protein CAP40_02500 [Sphingomonas sp. IBVSS2]|uniref:hypothetical protein n=1 Tax=Sphingomonas sp. IBVSS2 TaxID=1985172 RepID=UPI000A2E725D|nr:hypothetical protein [Sphingomonas sp. IBVSS2]OSZ69739.1 hypothetical protein CAP40_02500 [Sphingomonas sp. IBVSS2]